ncbi:MAG: hypothetical protein INF75_00545 [Roseomonas sp.]|nr:hypothetical protein [Roseomonas sp.]MCA3327323.1 hypothetical protein [Roseomonas sp.]MCA3330748.1 hypothetical protein [Roseomonas sp.]MCA3334237.1 hypothetical protein [Roseomonas sp.]MCA3347394.1 hypothetical protein [Roseomonas sp.]
MTSYIRLAVAGMMLGSLAACASNPAAAPPTGAKRLQVTEIRTLLAQPVRFDNSITGGLSYSFAPDGTVGFSMRMLPAVRTGAWKIDGEQLCITVDSGSWECGALYRLGPAQYYFDLPGYDAAYNTLNCRP